MSKPRQIDPLLQSLLHAITSEELPEVDARLDAREQKIEALRDGFKRIQGTDPTRFRPGDLVRWQPGLKCAKFPEYSETVVVVECLDPPIIDGPQGSGSPYFRESLSLVVGMVRDGNFHCWHYDGRRFERATDR